MNRLSASLFAFVMALALVLTAPASALSDSKRLTKLEATVAELQTTDAKLLADDAATTSRLQIIASEIDTLKATPGGVDNSARIASLEQEVSSIKAILAGLQTRLDAHDLAIADQADINRVQGLQIIDLKAADSAHDAKDATLEARIAALEGSQPPPGPAPEPDPAPVTQPHLQPTVAFPTTADGLPIMQLGLGFNDYWGLEQPWINAAKGNTIRWEATRKSDGKRLTYDELVAAGAIDPGTRYPVTADGLWSIDTAGIFEGVMHGVAPSYYAGTWVIDWKGVGSAGFSFIAPDAGTFKVISPNRVEGTFAAPGTRGAVGVTAASPTFSDLRVYRKDQEALLNAGKILTPDFVKYASRYKILRTMDMQSANLGWARTADQFIPPEAVGWGVPEPTYSKQLPQAFPYLPLFQMAMETNTALWMHVVGVIGAPAEIDDAYEHVEQIDPIVRAHAKEIVASPEWDRVADKLVDALIRSGYPENRRLYISQNNEGWNWGFWRKWRYYQSMGQALSNDTQGSDYGYGFLLGRQTHAIEKALAKRGRKQAWVSVMERQAASPYTTEDALKGYIAYFESQGMDPKPWLKIVGVSVASYYGGALRLNSGVVTAQAGETLPQAWLREIATDPDGLSKRVADWLINGSSDWSLSYAAAKQADHQKIAEKYGAFYVSSYEGESHDDAPAELRDVPAYISWLESFRYGPQGERVTKAWVETMYAQNPSAGIANYFGVSPPVSAPGLLAPWADGFTYTEENGRTRGLAPFLRK